LKSRNVSYGKKLLADLKLYADYYKWRDQDNRFETWEEACEDIIDGHRMKYFGKRNVLEPYFRKATKIIKTQRALASQRNLQFRGPQVLQHNARMYNCTSLYICRERAFQESFYLGLCGCGVGWGLLIPMVNNLSPIAKRTKGTKTYIIPDSIEGWADSLGVLMSSYFTENQPFPEYAGYEIKFDYSEIRPEGAYINGGYKAPGPEGLKQALEKIEALIENWLETEGSKVRPILAYDILCHSADAVLSGGVRRSAANAIVDPNDQEMIEAKVNGWRDRNPQRGRSNNSVLLVRKDTTQEQFTKLIHINRGDSDIGFVFANSYFDMFNPCYEILKVPILVETDFSEIPYEEIEEFISIHKDLCGVQACNLTEINAEKITDEKSLFQSVEAAAILGTLQAGYTNFPYLGKVTEDIIKRENLLGVSITGWMNNPWLLENPESLQKGAKLAIKTNEKLAEILGINPAARVTAVKPSGNSSVVLQVSASGANPSHSQRYFRIMQLNKITDIAKLLEKDHPYLIEESVWSNTNTDYAIFIPIENPEDALFKSEIKDIKHLELVRYIQQNWVIPGTVKERCVYDGINHNTSCTIVVSEDKYDEVADYIWENRADFTAMSFAAESIDKDYNQAPFTAVLNEQEILDKYGKGALLASGLIVDALQYFNNNLWEACDFLLDKDKCLVGTRDQLVLRKYWLQRARKFSRNYFKGDHKRMVHCLKDIHLFHKWNTINRNLREIDLTEVLPKPEYRNIGNYGAAACSGGACEITRI
jgi:ribonucleoside-triphosphate reductase